MLIIINYTIIIKVIQEKINIALCEIERKQISDIPISASRVRDLIDKGDIMSLKKLVPDTTFEILIKSGKIKEG